MSPFIDYKSFPQVLIASYTAGPVILGNNNISHLLRAYSVLGFVIHGNYLI